MPGMLVVGAAGHLFSSELKPENCECDAPGTSQSIEWLHDAGTHLGGVSDDIYPASLEYDR